MILNTEFSLIWATPWPDAKQLFLNFSKICNSRNSQNTVWKPNFFLGKLYQQIFGFLLSLPWGYSIPLVWFGQLLDPMKKNFFRFSKICNSRNSQNSVSKTIFFPGKLYQQLLALHCHYTGDTQYRVWFDLDNSLTRWRTFLKFSKNCNSRNSQNSVSKTFFFLGKLYQQLLALHCPYTGDTQYRV